MLSKSFFSIPEAAGFCSLSRVTLWKYVKSGLLRAKQTPGGRYRIRRDDLIAFFQENDMLPTFSLEAPRRKILVVDNDEKTLKLLERMLSAQGFAIDMARDGFDAGAKVVRFQPDMVVLDLFMPGMDGFEVCRRIKQDPETAHIRVLAVTGYDNAENRSKILTAGADGYLVKPIEREPLTQQVLSLMARATKPQPAGATHST